MSKTLFVYTDGGAKGNPGPAAVGVYIHDECGKTLAKFGKKIGLATNNVAEYLAVIEALGWILKNKENPFVGNQEIMFFSDSRLVVNQLNGLFKIKKPHLARLIILARKLEKEIGQKISYHLISREKNFIADSLVNIMGFTSRSLLS